MDDSTVKIYGVYAAFVTLIFGATGLLETAAGLGLADGILNVPADIFGGLSLLVVAAVYAKGLAPLLSGKTDGYAYLFVGALLSFAISGLYWAMFSATWFGENVVSGFEPAANEALQEAPEPEETAQASGEQAEEEEAQDPPDSFRLELLYFLLVLPGYYRAKKRQEVQRC